MKKYNLVDDGKIRGILKLTKVDFAECIKIDCPFLDKCQQNSTNIHCIYPKPKVKTEFSKQKLESREKNWFKRTLQNLRLKVDKEAKNKFHNNTHNEFITDLARHLANESTPALNAQYVGVASTYAAIDKETALVASDEIARVAVDTPTRTNAQVTITATFGAATGTTFESTISSSPSPTTTVFTVDDTPSDIEVGDTIQVQNTNGYSGSGKTETREVTGVSGSQITVSPALSIAPNSGDTFKQVLTRIYLLHGTANADPSISFGRIISLAGLEKVSKTSTQIMNVEYQISFI